MTDLGTGYEPRRHLLDRKDASGVRAEQDPITKRIVHRPFTMSSGAELREIRAFLSLAAELHFGRAAELHFGRAAERLDITPSYAGQLIRRLETQLGGRLFDRTSRHVSLTPLGQQLLAKLEPAQRQLDDALAEARAAATGITGTVRIGSYLRVLLGPRMTEVID